MGPVPGILGTLAAMEALKILAGGSLAESILSGKMLLYDALDPAQCRTCRLSKQCTSNAVLQQEKDEIGAVPPSIDPEAEMSAEHLASRLRSRKPTLVIDVRQPPHTRVARIATSENWPLTKMARMKPEELRTKASALAEKALAPERSASLTTVCVCRRGNDSRLATRHLREAGIDAVNLTGGLRALASLTPPELSPPSLT